MVFEDLDEPCISNDAQDSGQENHDKSLES